jgi:type I restriction enzyme S subunit
MKDQTEDIFEPAVPVVPQDWDVMSFEQAVEVISDRSKRVKQREYLPSGKLPVIDQGQDFIGGYTDDENLAFEGELPVILFGDHTRSIKYVNKPFAVGAEGVKILKPSGGFDPKYLYYLLRSLQIPSRGYSRHFQFLRKFHFPRAPEGQQKQIVAEIEKQFSRLDEAVANLKRVKANLKRYKAAVLKAAVEGHLVETEADLARREGRSYETGEQLLQRILETRRSQWKGKGKYKEPAASDTTDLPELPEGWVWAQLDAIAALKGGITVDSKRKDSTARLVPYLRVANVQRGYLDLSEVKFIDAPQSDINELRLQNGDILFNEGGDRDKLGRGWIWEGQLADCIHQNHVFRGRLFSKDVSAKLVSWWGNSFGKDYFSREGKQTTNLASINLTKLSAFPVPIPPCAEQLRVVVEIDRRLTVIREVEAQVDANLKRAQNLRQAILAKCFSCIPSK